jgi:hypothetical protein
MDHPSKTSHAIKVYARQFIGQNAKPPQLTVVQG